MGRRSLSARRAWIEISFPQFSLSDGTASLSARRAWIEIRMGLFPAPGIMVALRKESVDRNQAADISARRGARSLSARRAWIEIKYVVKDSDFSGGRSPQGERG